MSNPVKIPPEAVNENGTIQVAMLVNAHGLNKGEMAGFELDQAVKLVAAGAARLCYALKPAKDPAAILAKTKAEAAERNAKKAPPVPKFFDA